MQVGAFTNFANAERLRDEMAAAYGPATLVQRDGTPPLWRVIVGGGDWDTAFHLAQRIRAERGEAFVVRLDETPPR